MDMPEQLQIASKDIVSIVSFSSDGIWQLLAGWLFGG